MVYKKSFPFTSLEYELEEVAFKGLSSEICLAESGHIR